MNEKTLRALVREEVEHALDEEATVDSHPKFRRLVEAKLGRRFDSSEDSWTETYQAWSATLMETDARHPDRDIVEYYVNDAAKAIRAQNRG
jgi:hypothetical protein